uniref:peptidylprolyl isomerase n=1 Tax=Ciona intestinalis TaxID=7719 RepID=H2Y2A8_CIOIN|nr:peptidyl-prolyl cis-trans isomerase FKBP3 [Ciona intestinalis]|eukprot:XP_026690136.1 peptidyl-prolyl cis-trans isomerase FKBP3 [Ciona intestinalis]
MAATTTVEQQWDKAALLSDTVGKKEIVQFLQENAAPRFLAEEKLQGSLKNVVKTSKKDHLAEAYLKLFENKAFKGSEYDTVVEVTAKVGAMQVKQTKKKEEEDVGPPKFKKTVIKKGDKVNFPKRGDKVSCYYVGKLENGTVFDSLQPGSKKKKNMPLVFKVGKENVIKGWDEALLTMSVGEKAEITIEPEWAYGKAGKPEAKIPPNSTLIFEVDLYRID